MGSNLSVAEEGVLLTWIEPTPRPGAREPSHALRFAILREGAWSEPRTIATGEDFFANWADFPSIVRARDGSLLAHWLQKSAPATYAYDVQLARSVDGGVTWARLGPLNDDAKPTEHGFVSLVDEETGVRAFWLDGRDLDGGEEGAGHGGGHGSGAMTLRTALVTDTVREGWRLDPSTCECCQTSAAMTSEGPVVVYRDRAEGEIRDISIVRRTAQGWTDPHPVHVDGWEVPGCPVNGPAVAAEGRIVAVAWHTASGGRARVLVAFSGDAGATFGEPIEVDAADPPGRVGVVLDAGGDAIVSWLAAPPEERPQPAASASAEAAVRVRRVSASGAAAETLTVASSTRSRSSGFPRMVRAGETLVIAWTESGEVSHVRAALLAAADVPAARGAASPPRAPRARAWDGKPGSLAPDYAAPTLDGGRLALADLRGQPVLLNLWATWCAPCRQETPALITLHRRFAPRGLRVVGVSVDERAAASSVRDFVAENALPYAILHDADDRASGLFGVPALPGSFLFNRAGVLVWRRLGALRVDDPDLARAMDEVLTP